MGHDFQDVLNSKVLDTLAEGMRNLTTHILNTTFSTPKPETQTLNPKP